MKPSTRLQEQLEDLATYEDLDFAKMVYDGRPEDLSDEDLLYSLRLGERAGEEDRLDEDRLDEEDDA